jgi:hypothetical protein
MLKQRILYAVSAMLVVTGVKADGFLPPHRNQAVATVEAAWNSRAQQYFPAGTPVDQVVAALEEQGFVIDEARSHADLQLPGLFCRKRFQLVWTGEVNVDAVVGTFGLICL